MRRVYEGETVKSIETENKFGISRIKLLKKKEKKEFQYWICYVNIIFIVSTKLIATFILIRLIIIIVINIFTTLSTLALTPHTKPPKFTDKQASRLNI